MRPAEGSRRSGRQVEKLAAVFRRLPVPVIGRIQDGMLLFDLRTLDDPRHLTDQLAHLDWPRDSKAAQPSASTVAAVAP
jgi:L-seryl-tRNA(Ser) seleniumtransferase